jgi:hypothetical protein
MAKKCKRVRGVPLADGVTMGPPRDMGALDADIEAKFQELPPVEGLVWRIGADGAYAPCELCAEDTWHLTVGFFPCNTCGGWHDGTTCTRCGSLTATTPHECNIVEHVYWIMVDMARKKQFPTTAPLRKHRRSKRR